jgi:osmotically-inducible protein OsmY
MDDKELLAKIANELEFEPRVDARHIGVAVAKGVVTLSGYVSSYAEKLAAEAAARRVRGVRGLAQEIEVRCPEDKKTADDEIARRALDIIDWDVTVPDHAVQVKVERGWVTLIGEVEWQYQRNAAEEDVRRLPGVKGVINRIVLKPSFAVADVQRRIEDALTRRSELGAKAIRISAEGGKVVLEGTVHSWDEREAVERAAWSAPGVLLVDDRLTIS